MTGSEPLITVVTPSFNQAEFLAGVIQNVRAQGRDGVQHIVIDGGSTDGTLDVLRACGDDVIWVSEPDRGQSHAINKGFEMADGDILCWINCDDRYTPGALDFVRCQFSRAAAPSFLYGDALGVDLSGRSYGLRTHVRACDLQDLIFLGDPIVQPAAFWTRDLWREVGVLDEDVHYAFDYEYWMRVAARYALTYLPICLAIESLHGEAKSGRGDRVRMLEIEAMARRHGGTGVPAGFRAEAAALEMGSAVSELLHGRLAAAGEYASAAVALRPRVGRFAAHAIANALPSREAVPRLRLLANRARSHRTPVYPSGGGHHRPVGPRPAVKTGRAVDALLVRANAALVHPFTLEQHAPRPLLLDTRPPPRSWAKRPMPSICVVMPSFNQADFVEDAIRSLLEQNYAPLEFVVRDGASSDGTQAVLDRYRDRLTLTVSEPDDGQADALNKGFAETTGEIMGWLNSDDLLLPQAIETIGTYFARHPEVDVVYGHRVVVDDHGRQIGRWLLPADSHTYLDWADYIPQETLYWRRTLWESVGARLDPSFGFALDWELLLRFADAGARFARIPVPLGAFRVHDASKTVGQIDDVGSAEMARLRSLRCGRRVTEAEVHRALRPLFVKAWAARICPPRWRG